MANKFEADARNSAEIGEFEDAVNYAKLWFLDMPFSRGAILFGSQVAANNLDDHNETIQLYKAGLTSHPNDPQMLNNLMYSLCLSNNLKEADAYWQKFSNIGKTAIPTEICITATKGLYNFRKGLQEQGREYYTHAIEKAVNSKEQKLANQAFVNYLREEIIVGNEI